MKPKAKTEFKESPIRAKSSAKDRTKTNFNTTIVESRSKNQRSEILTEEMREKVANYLKEKHA